MLVQPPKFIENSLAAKVNEVRINGKHSCLGRPETAAVHLKTKDDLAMFYGESHTVAFTAVLATAIQAVVAIVATAVAFAFGGNSHGSSKELNDQVSSEDVFDMDIDTLLDTRRSVLVVA